MDTVKIERGMRGRYTWGQGNECRMIPCYHSEPVEYATVSDSMLPQDVIDAVYSAPRGWYQQGLVDGTQIWSGADLAGEARRWGARYAESRDNLCSRISDALPAGYSATVELVLHGEPRRWRSELVIWTPRGPHIW